MLYTCISHGVQGDMLYITVCREICYISQSAGRYAIYHTVCREIYAISVVRYAMHMQVNVYHTESAEIHYISHSLQGDMLYITQCAGRYAIYHTVSREICYIHCTCISHSLEICYLSHSLREICYISHSV